MRGVGPGAWWGVARGKRRVAGLPEVTGSGPSAGSPRGLVARLRDWTAGSAYPVVTGLVLTALAFVEFVAYPPDSVTIALGVLVSAVCLVWRRSFPPLAVLAVAAGMTAFAAGRSLYLVTIVSGLVGLYTLARHRVQRPWVLVLAGTLGAAAVNVVHIASWPEVSGLPVPEIGAPGSLGLFAETFVLAVVIVGAVSMGDAVRTRREARRERVLSQAKVIAMERREAAAEERTAIARELHDIVAHSVSMIAVQAESATYTTPGLSPEARDGFQQIAGTARASMTELRRLLGVLRTPGGEMPQIAPQPTLGHLPELLDQHRAVGEDAVLRVTGERVVLPAGWELSAYRIVQEALTNVRKHASGARTLVEVDYGTDRRLLLRITDDGPGRMDDGPGYAVDGPGAGGHGLTGMRERAALVGGTLTAGAGADGGFVVVAELPW